jgi:hypothetical protein
VRIHFKNSPKNREWHSWYAWHPVPILDGNYDICGWSWLETVGRKFGTLAYLYRWVD